MSAASGVFAGGMARLAQRPRLVDGLALVAGALLPFAFAPYDWRLLAIVSPALFLVLLTLTPRSRAFWRGWLYGLGQFGAGVYWLYFSFHLFGDAVAPLAGLLTLGFVAFLAVFPGVLAYALVRSCLLQSPLGLMLIAPSLWLLFEWLRGWLLGGFPWLLLGYSQIDGPLRGFAALGGVFLISWLLALTAGLVAAALSRRWHWPTAVLIALLWPLGAWLSFAQWTRPAGEPVRVALIQGNIPQDRKFQTETMLAAIEDYMAMTKALREVDLVLWPETAVPTFYNRVERMLRPLAREMTFRGVDVATGVFVVNAEGRYHNSVIKLGEPEAVYHKQHLVPFGEYLPLRDLLAVLDRWIAVPMSDISPGPAGQAPLELAGHPVAVSVCYEDAFGTLVAAGASDARLLLNVSNDSWFGDTSAPHQHLEIARMRTLETGRPLLRATNTGISAVIDHRGRILAQTRQFTRGATRAAVYAMSGSTPFMVFGNRPLVALCILLLIAHFGWRSFAARQAQALE